MTIRVVYTVRSAFDKAVSQIRDATGFLKNLVDRIVEFLVSLVRNFHHIFP